MARLLTLLAAIVALTTSCSGDYISVQSQGIYIDHLASMNIDTPDPRKKDPSIGERLIIRWSFPANVLHQSGGTMYLVQTIRFGNMETEVKRYPVTEASGKIIYSLLDDDYFGKEGISTYKFELVANEQVIEQWKHQVWVDYIDVEVDDELTLKTR